MKTIKKIKPTAKKATKKPLVKTHAVKKAAPKKAAKKSTPAKAIKKPPALSLLAKYQNERKSQEHMERKQAKALQEAVTSRTVVRTPMMDVEKTVAMDESQLSSVKAAFNLASSVISWGVLGFFANQSFIGHQICGILAQHWFIEKACRMPGEDAIRNGYELSINDGTKLKPAVLDRIRELDSEYNIRGHLIEFEHKRQEFGIRIMIFKIKNARTDYYELPFNADSITPGSFEGLVQVDPMWCAPILDIDAASNPASLYFYEPTWWQVNGIKYHRTHLVIGRTGKVADVIKPTYYYGGVPRPQKIYERVYCAERTANEAPRLAINKRTKVLHTDMSAVLGDQEAFDARQRMSLENENNFSQRAIDTGEKLEFIDTSLADLDQVIGSQYQIACAAAEVPAVKMMGLDPGGLGNTGSFSEGAYRSRCRDIQCDVYNLVLARYYDIVARSDLKQSKKSKPMRLVPVWNRLDDPTAKEHAEILNLEADRDLKLVNAGAVSSDEVRARVFADPKSGYNGIEMGRENPSDTLTDTDAGSDEIGND